MSRAQGNDMGQQIFFQVLGIKTMLTCLRSELVKRINNRNKERRQRKEEEERGGQGRGNEEIESREKVKEKESGGKKGGECLEIGILKIFLQEV